MRSRPLLVAALCACAAGCGAKSAQRTYSVHGQIVAITPDRLEATVKHGEIKGLMPAMTMAYSADKDDVYAKVKPGDQITAKVHDGDFKTLYGVEVVPAKGTPQK